LNWRLLSWVIPAVIFYLIWMFLFRRIAAGAADFFEKPFDDASVLASVRSALQQQDGATRRFAEHAEIERRLAALSPREHDVLRGLVKGRANKQIAFDLGISPRTMEIYRANVMNKMGANRAFPSSFAWRSSVRRADRELFRDTCKPRVELR
jgi:DNA-binding NarL/FixJ family response regulator